jgi:hypothetical protein
LDRSRELVFDTSFSGIMRLGKDEDVSVLVLGARPDILVQLPATTAVGRTVAVVETVGIPRALAVRTADYGADNLRVLKPVNLRANGRERFVFDNGYWQHRDGATSL